MATRLCRRSAATISLTAGMLLAVTGTALADGPSLDGAPPSVTNSTSASISYSGEGSDPKFFLCSIDGGEWSDCPPSPVGFQGLSDGEHSLAVQQVDDYGYQVGSIATASWTVDATAPSAPNVTLPANGGLLASSTVEFRATGESGSTFMCSLDSGTWTVCPSASGPAPGDQSRLAVGWNTILHWGEASNWTSMKWGQTNSNGTVQWNGVRYRSDFAAAYGSDAVTLQRIVHLFMPSLSCSYIDGLGPSSSLYIVAGTPDQSSWNSYDVDCDDTTTTEVPAPTPGTFSDLADGPHTLAVRQDDEAGNDGAETSVSWTVDTTAPSAPIAWDDSGSMPSGTVWEYSYTIRFRGDQEAGSHLECSTDGGAFAYCGNADGITGMYALADGPHSFAVREVDAAGNVGEASTYSWTVDRTAPDAPSFASTPPALTKARNATFTITRSEPGGTLECKLDARAWATCSETTLFRLLGSGAHTLLIRQKDAVGNVSSTESASWTVDATPPAKPTLSGVPAARTRSWGATITVTRAEPGGTLECKLDAGPWVSCTDTITYRILPRGPHTLLVRQRDESGNGGEAETASWTIDLTAPAKPTVTSAPPALLNSRTATVEVERSEPGGTLECKLDARLWAACSDTITLRFLNSGARTLLVRQRDAAGNPGEAETVTWTVDVTAPSKPTLSGVPSSPTPARSLTITVTPTESGGTFECRRGTAAWFPCSTTVSLANLTPGVKTVQVRHRDAAGNASPSAVATWRVI